VTREHASITIAARESVAVDPHVCKEAHLTLTRVLRARLTPAKSTRAAANTPERDGGRGGRGVAAVRHGLQGGRGTAGRISKGGVRT